MNRLRRTRFSRFVFCASFRVVGDNRHEPALFYLALCDVAAHTLFMGKTMSAKFGGKCACCGQAFEAGARIQYDGRAILVSCIEEEIACDAAKDAEDAVRQAAWSAKFKAGELVRESFHGDEMYISLCPSYETARIHAMAFVYSIRLAGGKAQLVTKIKGGKRYVGREVVNYYGNSNIGHHEGWAFKFRVEAP